MFLGGHELPSFAGWKRAGGFSSCIAKLGCVADRLHHVGRVASARVHRRERVEFCEVASSCQGVSLLIEEC